MSKHDEHVWRREAAYQDWAHDWCLIPLTHVGISISTHEWLLCHVGERHTDWILPKPQLLLIRNPECALLFMLEGIHHD